MILADSLKIRKDHPFIKRGFTLDILALMENDLILTSDKQAKLAVQ